MTTSLIASIAEPGSEGFALRLFLARKDAQMTQAELARRIGMTQPTVVDYEAGRRIPRVDVVESIAKALGVKPNDLIRWK